MKKIKTFLWTFLLVLTALWWFTHTPVLAGLTNFLSWRGVLMQYSGVLALGVMSVAMVLAVRPVLFEPTLGGLDKMYRLHKWLGISGRSCQSAIGSCQKCQMAHRPGMDGAGRCRTASNGLRCVEG